MHPHESYLYATTTASHLGSIVALFIVVVYVPLFTLIDGNICFLTGFQILDGIVSMIGLAVVPSIALLALIFPSLNL